MIVRGEKLEATAAKRLRALALGENALHPPQQRTACVLLRFNVERLVLILGIDNHRQVQLLGIGARESSVAIRGPLHRRAHAVAIAKVEIVAHADLVAVIDDRRAWQRQEQRIH